MINLQSKQSYSVFIFSASNKQGRLGPLYTHFCAMTRQQQSHHDAFCNLLSCNL